MNIQEYIKAVDELFTFGNATEHSYQPALKQYIESRLPEVRAVIDFPRIPYPTDAATFWNLVSLGGEIRRFHLLEHPALAKPITTFPVAGDCKVEKTGYISGRVHINPAQYFDGVPESAWNLYIDGYQPAQK